MTMTLQPANHFVISGKGISAVVDTMGFGGTPVVALEIDGHTVANPSFQPTGQGIVVDGFVSAIPDSETVQVSLTVPEVNLADDEVTFTGFAVLTTARTSIGGPGLVSGPLDLYELRPIAGTASIVDV